MSTIDDFKSAKLHANSKKLELYLPTGELSEHFLLVQGIKSKHMRKVKQNLLREAAKNIKENTWDDAKQEEFTSELLANTITGWSFENEEFNLENVKEFLADAPEIAEAVDVFCSDDKNYFEKK